LNLSEKELLIEAFTRYSDKFKKLLWDSNNGIVLFDENGVVLIDLSPEQEDRHPAFQRGAIWDEHTVGTCSHIISTINHKPAQVFGAQHYKEIFCRFTSSSAPIFDFNDEIVGVLTIASQNEFYTNSLTFGLAISLADVIQKEYFNLLIDRLNSSLRMPKGLHLFLFNRNWFLVKANDTAQELLPLKSTLKKQLRFQDLFGNQNHLVDELERGKAVYDTELQVKPDGKTVYLHEARSITNNTGKIVGYILALDEKANLVNKAFKSRKLGKDIFLDTIIGHSEELQKVKEAAKRITAYDVPVLIQGESGTGKEVFARAIHNEKRFGRPFVALNCAAIPHNLIESELFGYESGAFTGADKKGRVGKIEMAHGGTLFLDEIGDMPLDLQPVLLRVLEDKQLMRVGGNKYISVNFNLITATNKDLLELVRNKKFREDLYYRLAAFKITLPPLRKRKPDIANLAEYFIQKKSADFGIEPPKLSEEALLKLLEYSWPGNIRQLENAIMYAIVMSNNNLIKAENLPQEVLLGETIIDESHASLTPTKENDEQVNLHDLEMITILDTLKRYNYQVAPAARDLGLSRSTLYRRIKKYGLSLKEIKN